MHDDDDDDDHSMVEFHQMEKRFDIEHLIWACEYDFQKEKKT